MYQSLNKPGTYRILVTTPVRTIHGMERGMERGAGRRRINDGVTLPIYNLETLEGKSHIINFIAVGTFHD